MIGHFLLRLVVNAIALALADYFLAGFAVGGLVGGYLVGGAVLALLQGIIKPVLKLLTLPFILMTFGLFTVAINMFLLWLTSVVVDSVVIGGFMNLLWATLIVSAVDLVLYRPSDNNQQSS